MDISKLKVVDLKKELKNRGLNSNGTKNELMERLQEALNEDETGDSGALENDDLLDEEAVLADESDEAILDEGSTSLTVHEDDAALLTPTMASAPKLIKDAGKGTVNDKDADLMPKKVIINRKVAASVAPDNVEEGSKQLECSQDSDDKLPKKIIKLDSLSLEERAKLRAQKFGVPVPDSLKKAARAERFGVADVASKPPATDEKLAKRQARFNIAFSDETSEAKKKRAERFGNGGTTNGAGNDEQRRKRAERFGLA